MVRLAYLQHKGKRKLVAEIVSSSANKNKKNVVSGYCDLSSISHNVRDFLEGGPMSIEYAQELISQVVPTTDNNDDTHTHNHHHTHHPLWIPASVEQDEETKAYHLLAPIDGALCGKFICIGMNYIDHCLEQNSPIPTEPMVFSKFGSCIIGPNDPIVCDASLTKKLDYEVELGIVIGAIVPRNSSVEELRATNDRYRYIGGYTVIHDLSARDWQLEKNGGQWLLGKAQDGYAPVGPVVVTSDEFADKYTTTTTTIDGRSSTSHKINLGIRCRINGRTRQDSNTTNLVHGVYELVSYLSKFMTLYPGDIISTGTPPGVGCFQKPVPLYLQPGDIVECEIDHIGTLTSKVIAPGPAPHTTTTIQPSSSSRQLHDMICIVTGAAQGIGYGIAAKLGYDGAQQVTIIDTNEEKVEKACDKLNILNPRCHYLGIVCDVTNLKQVEAAWEQAATAAARIDILVQAAGIVGKTAIACGATNFDVHDFDNVMNVNVRGIINGCQVVLPYMKKNQFGRIVNIASIAGKEGNAGMVSYSTSKAAVIGLTKSIGKECASSSSSPGGADITCNAIAPAVVNTEMVQNMPPEQVQYMTDKIPMKRCGTIHEIANLVSFIVSPTNSGASFTTGFCFDASGGRAVY